MGDQLPDIETRNLSELHEWEGNARRGDVEAIKHSMLANGVFNPIGIQKSTKRVIYGNHRLRALKELHEEQPDQWPGSVSVIPLDVSDDEALRIHLADNKTSDDAEWDHGRLLVQLEGLAGSDRGLLGTGFGDEELADLRALLADPGEDDAEEDEGSLWGSFTVEAPSGLVSRAEDALDSYPGDTRAARLEALLDSHPNHSRG